MSDITLDEICVVAIAEAFRGDGEVLCNPMGPVPVIAGRLARATFEPDLMLTDTIAYAIEGNLPFGGDPSDAVIESYMPFRSIFDQVWSGKRHVVMGASQIDRRGNQNFAAIGEYRKPKAQLLGMRGAPGNLINHATTYWVPNQARAFSETVDVVSAPATTGSRSFRRRAAPTTRSVGSSPTSVRTTSSPKTGRCASARCIRASRSSRPRRRRRSS
ncbi:MAG: hypothetical protein AAF548_14320 [Actinomycetota bacterium]